MIIDAMLILAGLSIMYAARKILKLERRIDELEGRNKNG